MDIKLLLLVLLTLVAAGFLFIWFGSLRRARVSARAEDRPAAPTPLEVILGAVTNFFDTLGIGSYAPTTAVFKLKRLVPDERIPGTLTIGHTLPTVTQALIFISIVQVEILTLVTLIAASILGAWLGAGVVARWPRRKVQFGMGFALLAAAGLFIIKNLDEMRGAPVFPGGLATGLDDGLLIAAIVGSFVLGALMTIGVGMYAPALIMISLMGMNPRAAFPIMMGSCAFLMPIAGTKFLEAKSYSPRPALGLALGGVPAVLVAALIVKQLPLTALRWLVVLVVLYSAAMMLRSGIQEARAPKGVPLPP